MQPPAERRVTTGTDCSGIFQPPRFDRLQDQTIILSINARVDANTLGLGMVLAGGWKDWFAIVPVSATWVDPTDSVADGSSLTVAPRLGRLFHLGGISICNQVPMGTDWVRRSIRSALGVPKSQMKERCRDYGSGHK